MLSSGSVSLDRLPNVLLRRLPRHPVVPIVMMGRLAVDQFYQGIGLARYLLAGAVHKVRQLDIGVFALTVAAKDDESEAFYRHHGFVKL